MYVVRCNRSRERNLLFEINGYCIWINNLAYSLVSNRSFQYIQVHLQYGLTIEYVLFANLQRRSYAWVKEFYWRRQYLFFRFQGDCLICSKLEIHIVLLHLVEEEASESLFHLATSRNSPIVIQEDCAGRTVRIEIKSYISIRATIVLNHEVEFLVGVLHCVEVKIEPFLTSSNGYACPIEINRFCTSVINDFSSLVHIGRNSDLLV